MTTRKLGNSGLEIPALVFGGNVFGWTADESTSFRLLDALLDAGLNCIDTADVYSRWVPGHQGGESETLIGKWLKRTGKRDRMVIASKVGMDMSNGHKGLSAAYIEQALERSLRRLQTDYLDLYQSHTDDPHTDLEETLSTYGELIKKGKVRVIGASNYDARRLLEARQVSARLHLPSYQSLQPEYNLYDRADYETNLEPTVEELGIGVISYYSLASGFLSGKYRSQADTAGRARGGEKVKGYLNERGVAILAALDEVAEQYNANPTQVALAWLIARPTVTAPIASATSLEQLDDLIAATHLKLDEQAIHRLDSASAY
ncbi:aldo/keto reductase [Pseudomonas aeruginosa]